MQKSCKCIDITNVEQILPYVTECCYRHYRRYDFKKLFLSFGMDINLYHIAYLERDKTLLDVPIRHIAEYCAKAIAKRKLNLPPIHIRTMADTTTGKIREIGKESAIQQCFDYIAVYSCMDMFRRRMVAEQASSIKNRGQLYGTRMIAKQVKKDYDSMRYAERHHIRYTSKCKYFVKLDIRKCYPTAQLEKFLPLLEHDCGSTDIMWIWEQLLLSHRSDGNIGFMIGALPSQWACQLMISYIYRHTKSLAYTRNGNRHKCVEHMVCFMDDMLLMAGNRKQLFKAVKSTIKFTKDFLGWEIKPNWHIKDLEHNNIDMMGFVVRRNGSIGIRGRNFIHSRRIVLRYGKTNKFTITQARRLTSYKGYYKYTNSRSIVRKLKLNECFASAASTVSKWDRRNNNGSYKD